MLYTLPPNGKPAIPLPHFPTRHQAFLFRAWEYIPAEIIAKILKTDTATVRQAAADMGLPDYAPGDLWLRRGYITILRRMWHILPYDQLLELLDTDEQSLARLMREDDFLDIKLSDKPACERVEWRELSEEEREETRRIKEIMSDLDMSGVRPFDFAYDVPELTFSGEERFATRMIYAFSGLYQHAFDVDSEEFLPDDQLRAYQKLGINGIWTQGILAQLAPFPFDPALSAGYETRLTRMRAMTERLARFGIKLYLYLNEPRSMPLSFFDSHPELKGHTQGENACLCVSSPQVREYLADAVESVCRSVPLIGGFFTITRSENLTNCYSHADKAGNPCSCPRCREKSVGEVIASTVASLRDGARRVRSDIKVFAWSWGWNEYSEEIIRLLPRDVILLSQSELDMPFEIGGVKGNVIDYSMSIVGPGERARNEWRLARELGLEIGAKVQINTTWEASTVPAIPVSPSVEEHMDRLQSEGVRHLLLSWTLGGYPSPNIAAAAKYFYDGCTCVEQKNQLRNAEQQFVRAFSAFPFHLQVLYLGPQNAGPSSLLFESPTGYRSTMTCFAYDDLESWRGIYPVDTFEAQLARLCREWELGLRMIPEGDRSERAVMAGAAYCLFRSSLHQTRFIRARDEGRLWDAVAEAKRELEMTEQMLLLMNQNAAIGYEAANHYYFSKGQLAEKIINCRYIVEALSKKAALGEGKRNTPSAFVPAKGGIPMESRRLRILKPTSPELACDPEGVCAAVTALEAACFPPAEAAPRESFAARLQAFPDRFWLLYRDGELVSMVNGSLSDETDLRDEMFHDADLHTPEGRWQMIFGVATHPDHQRKGYASLLLRRMLEDCRAEGREGSVLTCKQAKLSYYARFGYVAEGISSSEHGGAVWYQMRVKF